LDRRPWPAVAPFKVNAARRWKSSQTAPFGGNTFGGVRQGQPAPGPQAGCADETEDRVQNLTVIRIRRERAGALRSQALLLRTAHGAAIRDVGRWERVKRGRAVD
jgi:hypothetical protein